MDALISQASSSSALPMALAIMLLQILQSPTACINSSCTDVVSCYGKLLSDHLLLPSSISINTNLSSCPNTSQFISSNNAVEI